MNELLRSFGRALAGVFHPVMLVLTVAPFAIAALGWGVLLYAFWQPLVDAVRAWLADWSFTATLYRLFDSLGFGALHLVVAPFVVIAMIVPLIVLTVLLLIVTMSMPRVIRHLSNRQFAALEMRHGGTFFGSLANSLWTTTLCIGLLVLTLPLWLVPPFFALIPPLLWGWLTYRVMTYDALALHASADERRALVRRFRVPLLAIGVVSGLAGALPTVIWTWSAWLLPFFPVVTVLTIWIYAFILVFTALWFGQYCLRALQRLRAQPAHDVATAR